MELQRCWAYRYEVRYGFSFLAGKFWCSPIVMSFVKELREFAIAQGMALFGVCRIEGIKEYIHPSIRGVAEDLSYGISIGYRLSDSVLATVVNLNPDPETPETSSGSGHWDSRLRTLSPQEVGPTLIYKHHYKTVNWILDQVAEKLANLIQQKGYRSLAIPASQTVDWERQEGHFSHLLVARECGHGWIGKSGLIVNPEHGAKVRYATILTDLPLGSSGAFSSLGCGQCRKCIEACPAGAISEDGYDKEKCLAKLREFAGMRGIGVYICGVCVAVCDGLDGN